MKNSLINLNSVDLRTSDRIIIMLVLQLVYMTYPNYIDYINKINALRVNQIQFVLYSNGSFSIYAHDLCKLKDFAVFITDNKQVTKIRRALRARLVYVTKNNLTSLNKNLINIIARSL